MQKRRTEKMHTKGVASFEKKKKRSKIDEKTEVGKGKSS